MTVEIASSIGISKLAYQVPFYHVPYYNVPYYHVPYYHVPYYHAKLGNKSDEVMR
jgi:hypothetical protein